MALTSMGKPTKSVFREIQIKSSAEGSKRNQYQQHVSKVLGGMTQPHGKGGGSIRSTFSFGAYQTGMGQMKVCSVFEVNERKDRKMRKQKNTKYSKINYRHRVARQNHNNLDT